MALAQSIKSHLAREARVPYVFIYGIALGLVLGFLLGPKPLNFRLPWWAWAIIGSFVLFYAIIEPIQIRLYERRHRP